MASPSPGERSRDRSLLVFGVGILLFATPLRLMWADAGRAWYLPFLLWAGVNLLMFWAAPSSRDHEA